MFMDILAFTVSDNKPGTLRQWLISSTLLALIFVVHLWSLIRLPAPFADEVWATNRAWGFIQTGKVFGTQDMGVFDRLEGYWTLFPWLPTAIQSIGLRIAGAPELFPMRLTSLLFGMALLIALYAIVYPLGGFRQALLSVLLCSVSLPFFYSGHLARFDILAASFGFIAIALYINNRTAPRLWLSFLSGLCLGLAFEIHPHSAIYGPAIVALYFLDYQWRMFFKRHFWGFGAGVALGLFFYVVLHILPYPQSYVRFNEIAFSATHTPPLFTLDVHLILQAFINSWKVIIPKHHVVGFLIPIAVVLMLKRRSESDKVLLTLAASLIIAYILLLRNTYYYYYILLSPVVDLISASFILQVSQVSFTGKRQRFIFHSSILSITILSILLNISIVRYDFRTTYQQVLSGLNEVILPSETIMGTQTYWLGLSEHIYYSWEGLVYYQRYAPGSTLEDALQAYRPDILIIDKQLAGFISDSVGESLYSQHLRLPKTELEAFLSRQANLILEYSSEYYGEIRVYRINWEIQTGESSRKETDAIKS